MQSELRQAMDARTDKSGGCWNWTGGMHGVGYGSLSKKLHASGYAHRAAYELANGPIPKGAYVLHKCDNRRCVNPAHLFVGSHLDNIKDMQAKGRHKGGSLPGAKNPSAKFSPEQIGAIRERAQAGVQKKCIEQEFGISETQYYRVVRGQSWKGIE